MNKNSKPRLLVIFLHGFGDNVMATPAIRELSAQYLIDIVVYEKTAADQIWLKSPYIFNVISVDLIHHPRYWNPVAFWLIDYWRINSLLKQYINDPVYDKVIISKIYLLPQFCYNLFPALRSRHHKIEQIAYEMGIHTLSSRKTEVFIPEDAFQFCEKFIRDNSINAHNKIITMQLTTGGKYRNLEIRLAQQVINQITLEFPEVIFIILGSPQNYIEEKILYGKHVVGDNVIYTYDAQAGIQILQSVAMIARSCLFVGIDSSMLHCAGALEKNTIAIFKASNQKQKPSTLIPLNPNITALCMDEVTCERIVKDISNHLTDENFK